MELKLIIDGKEKTFKQDKTSFATMQKALVWQDLLADQFKEYEQRANADIDEEIEVIDTSTPQETADKAIDLITSFFGGQFTYDDFVNSESFGSINDIYALAHEVMYTILGMKDLEDTAKKAISQQTK